VIYGLLSCDTVVLQVDTNCGDTLPRSSCRFENYMVSQLRIVVLNLCETAAL
jgi:hypothetical protein